jgi:hypothetical protein
MRVRTTAVSLITLCGSILMMGQGVLLAQEYNSRGKRDPFVSLLNVSQEETVRIVPPPPLDQRPPGLPGLLVSEVTVAGIAAGPGSQLVVLKGIDGASYLSREGTKLFDGFLEEVSADRVVFIQEQEDTRGQKRSTRIVKKLYSEER